MDTQIDKSELEVDPNAPLIPQHTKQASIAVLYLLFYSFLMFTLPFGTFYLTKYYLENYFDISDNFMLNAWSTFAAVLTVNFIIVLYAYKAYHEQEYDKDGNELNFDGTVREKKDE